MTDKNRDFSQIRVGKPVAADRPPPKWGMVAGQMYQVESLDRDATGTVYATIRVSALSRVVFYEDEWGDMGGYIVSQPEDQSVPEQASVQTRAWNVCRKCGRGETETYQPCPPDREDVEQWQKDQKEYFQANAREIVGEYAEWRDRQDALKLTEAEKRGDAAGYARRVAEEGGEAVAEVIGHFNPRDPMVLGLDIVYNIPIGTLLYIKPQPDTRDETIAELRLSEMHARADAEAARAKVAALEAENERLSKLCGALRCGSASLTVAGPGQDGSPGRSRALAATGGE